ncbi:MAG: hypothetical protein ACRCSZ_06305 [Lactococcus lactis]
MTEDILEVPKFLKPKRKNGRKKVIIRGPKSSAKKALALSALTEVILKQATVPEISTQIAVHYEPLSRLKETVALIELREGRSMQLTGDAKLLIKAIKELTKITEHLIGGNT